MKKLVVVALTCAPFVVCGGGFTTADSNPNACSSASNGTYNCNSSRGISTRFSDNVNRGVPPARQTTQVTPRGGSSLVQPSNAIGHAPAVYNDPGQVNGGGVAAGNFDFRSSNMVHNGIRPAVLGRCPGVVRHNMVVYYDCNSSAMIQYAQQQRRATDRISPEIHSGGL